MNATPATTTPTTAELRDLPLSAIRPSATNPRRHFDEAQLDDLTRSMKVSGLLQRVLVRPLKDEDGDTVRDTYELVIGARRFAAAEALGWETIPVECRGMSDAEAREAQIVENLQRADVHPLDEAEAFQEMLATLGSIAAVAAKLGKEQAYVAKCLRLVSLTLPSTDALRGGLITIEHALLLARLAEAEQNAALKWTLDHSAGSTMKVEKVLENARVRKDASGRQYQWEPQSIVKLKAFIEAESGILLSRAPWSLEDEDYLLPDVGPCSECPKNTKANTPLFGDLEMGEATCTDGACFGAKTAGFVRIEMRKAGHDDTSKPKVLVPRLSWKYSGVKPPMVDGTPNAAKVLKYGQWVVAKPKSCSFVRVGVTVDWNETSGQMLGLPGEVLQVCIAMGCKAHPKDWEKPKSKPSQGGTRIDPAAAEREEKELESVAKVERQLRSAVMYEILRKLTTEKALADLADQEHDAAVLRQRIALAMPELGPVTRDAFVLYCAAYRGALNANGYWLKDKASVANDRRHLFVLAKEHGVDAAAVMNNNIRAIEGSGEAWCERLYPAVPKVVAKKAAAKKKANSRSPARMTTKKTTAKKAVAKKALKKVASKAKAAKKAGKR